jgi:hypothetical protein
MGIFDDEVKKMAGEAADNVRSAAQHEDELNAIARNVSTDLLGYVRPQPGAVDVSVLKNEVTFTTQAPRRTFKIFCEGPDAFRVKETTGFQTAGRSGEPSPYSDQDVISRSKMARWVIARLNELRAA